MTKAEFKRMQRRFNAALEEGDTETAIDIGRELVKEIKSKPPLSDMDRNRIAIIEGMIVMMKAHEEIAKSGLLESMTPKQREMLPFVLIEMIVKIQRQRSSH